MAPLNADQLTVAVEEVIADEAKPVTVPQVAVVLVVNCACIYGPLPNVQLALTLQSYNEPGVKPLRFFDSVVIAVAALIHVPDDASL